MKIILREKLVRFMNQRGLKTLTVKRPAARGC
jgi:hypothetical protein